MTTEISQNFLTLLHLTLFAMKNTLQRSLSLLFVAVSGFINAQVNITNVLVDNTGSDGECTIIINRLSPNNILAAANPDRIYRSSDGGLTWIESGLNAFTSQPVYGDVTLATDSAGRYYYQSLGTPGYLLYTLRSTDFGATWNTETVIGNGGYLEDKNWLLVDNVPGSPYNGYLYCAWTRRPSNPNPGYMLFSHSDDNGQTWPVYDTIDSDPTIPSIGSGLAVGPSGELYVSWGGGSPNEIKLKKSTDAGVTWPGGPIVVDNNVQPVANYYATINHAISFSAQFTSLACDVSGGPYNGNLYCVWDDIRNGVNNADIFLARSTDGGLTWNTQRINNDTTTRNQVVPTVAVDPTSGWVYVSYLDARLNKDIDDDTLHYYLAWSNDGGQTFQTTRVSQQASTLFNIHSDYMGMDAYNGKVHLFWGGGTSNLQMWTACVTQNTLSAAELAVVSPAVTFYPAYPNPAIDFTTFDFNLPGETNVSLVITDLNGKEVAKPVDGKNYAKGTHQVKFNNTLAPGLYIATIYTSYGSSTRKFSILK